MLAAYLVFVSSYRSGCAVGQVVQVLVVGCVMVHIERQNETTWEDSTQGVIHLMGKYEHLVSLNKTATVQLNQEQLELKLHLCLDKSWNRGAYNFLGIDLYLTCLPHQELLQTCAGSGRCS